MSRIKRTCLLLTLAAGLGLASPRVATADEFYDLCTAGSGDPAETARGCTCINQRLTDPSERAAVIAYLRALAGLCNGNVSMDDPALKNGKEELFIKYAMQCTK